MPSVWSATAKNTRKGWETLAERQSIAQQLPTESIDVVARIRARQDFGHRHTSSPIFAWLESQAAKRSSW
jgi:hypothetical protein